MAKKKKKKVSSSGKQLYKGTLEVTRSGLGYVIVDGLEKDVLVKRENIRNALNGDEVRVEVSTRGKKIDCNNHLYVASSNLPGFKQSTVDQTVYYRDWTTATIDFNGLGGHTLAIDFTTADCGQGGHFGYGYLDLSCGMYEVYNINCKPDPSITLNAPPGFQQYIWMDTAFGLVYGYNESMTIPTPTKTIKFAVILKPYAGFGCDDTLYTTVKLSELITQTSSDTIICEGSTAKLVVCAPTVAAV